MPKIFIFILLSINSICIIAQDAKKIIQKAYAKCLSIDSGYHEISEYYKTYSSEDTFTSFFTGHFKKLKSDSYFDSKFHYKSYNNGKYNKDVMYTGKEYIYYNASDSSGTIILNSKWPDQVRNYSYNVFIISLLTNNKKLNFKLRFNLNQRKESFKYISEEVINGSLCYHIKVNRWINSKWDENEKYLGNEIHFWVRKDNFLPIQYAMKDYIILNKDTLNHYEKIVINKYELNNLSDEFPLSINSIPPYVDLKDFTPKKYSELLPKDTVAPNWTLVTLTNDTISLNDLKGRLVLIDFFFKGCYPCMMALPGLQALHEKYKDKGLVLVGIDPYDSKQTNIKEFLGKKGITYPVFLDSKKVAKDYRISFYPTLVLIDKNGKVIFAKVGSEIESNKELEKIIKQNL